MKEVRYIHDKQTHNPQSAKELAPLLIELFHPKNVVDVGCGLGAWLSVFKTAGVDILGMDGEWVNMENLHIPRENFKITDLSQCPVSEDVFDLALCMEVAEHLPESAAQQLVDFLCSLSETIIFSAAIPDQGGQNHLNEQEPFYWADLFAHHGYQFYDILRPKIWDNPNIKWWYRQNIFVVSKKELPFPVSSRTLIHPALFKDKTKELDDIFNGKIGLKKAIDILYSNFISFIKRGK